LIGMTYPKAVGLGYQGETPNASHIFWSRAEQQLKQSRQDPIMS